jgi:hypothetical protein
MADERSLAERLRNGLSSAAVTGYGISFLLHLLILLGMAFWVLPQLVKSSSVTTVVQSEDEAPQPLDTLDDVQLELPAGQDNQLLPQLTDVTLPQNAPTNLLEHQFLRDVTAAESQGEGGANGAGGSFRLLEPRNAVKAGSFTAWTIPIAQRVGEEVKAGDDPRPGQDYHIVIQIKAPDDRRVYSISDLSGRVIGTDGYVQVVPAQSYYKDEQGQLIRVRLGSRLPVVDGVVQILVRVPGAEALVKDTIVVESRRLKEEQTLELVFGRNARNDSP